jgi:hypothetical protein
MAEVDPNRVGRIETRSAAVSCRTEVCYRIGGSTAGGSAAQFQNNSGLSQGLAGRPAAG